MNFEDVPENLSTKLDLMLADALKIELLEACLGLGPPGDCGTDDMAWPIPRKQPITHNGEEQCQEACDEPRFVGLDCVCSDQGGSLMIR